MPSLDRRRRSYPPFPNSEWATVADVPTGAPVIDGGVLKKAGKKSCTFIDQSALPHYYCDSVGGSDANDGLTELTPKQTVAAVEALASGACVFEFKRGSYFREQHTHPFNGCVTKDYGTGDLPKFDCADVVDWVWTKVGGFTNVWEKTGIVTQLTEVGKVQGVLWFDGIRMIKTISTSVCDTTPGSYKIDITGAGVATIRVHSPASTDPNSDGYLYEYTKRNHGILTVGYGDGTGTGEVYNMYTMRNGHNNGSLIGSKYIKGCYGYDGSIHNIWNGGIAEDCTAYRGREGTSFISYYDDDNNATFRYKNCLALADSAPVYGWSNNLTGFYHHSGNGSKLKHVLYENCRAEQYYDGFGSVDVEATVYWECETIECAHGYRCDGDYIYNYFPFATLCGKTLQFKNASNIRYVLKGAKVNGVNTTAFGGFLRVNATQFDIENCSFYLINKTSAMEVVKSSNVSTLNMSKNIVANPTGCSWIESTYNLTGVLNSDYNLIQNNSIKTVDNATTYTTFSAYQTGLSQDANSLVGVDPLFTGDPATGDFSIDPSSPANTIGAGSTNYVVTAQDLRYMNVLNEV